jgi:hypothetical protein
MKSSPVPPITLAQCSNTSKQTAEQSLHVFPAIRPWNFNNPSALRISYTKNTGSIDKWTFLLFDAWKFDYSKMLYYLLSGTRWCCWWRHCTTSRKVKGSIELIVGSNQPLTEISTRGSHFCYKFLEPQTPGTLRACPDLYRDCFSPLLLAAYFINSSDLYKSGRMYNWSFVTCFKILLKHAVGLDILLLFNQIC